MSYYLRRVFLLESSPVIPADWVTYFCKRELVIEDNEDGGTGAPLLESYMIRPEYSDSRIRDNSCSHYTWRREKGKWVLDCIDSEEPVGGLYNVDVAKGSAPMDWDLREISPSPPKNDVRHFLQTLTAGPFFSRRKPNPKHVLHITFSNESAPKGHAQLVTNPPEWAGPCTEITTDPRFSVINLAFRKRFPEPRGYADKFNL